MHVYPFSKSLILAVTGETKPARISRKIYNLYLPVSDVGETEFFEVHKTRHSKFS